MLVTESSWSLADLMWWDDNVQYFVTWGSGKTITWLSEQSEIMVAHYADELKRMPFNWVWA
jgi:hypothetical protein